MKRRTLLLALLVFTALQPLSNIHYVMIGEILLNYFIFTWHPIGQL